MLALLLDTVFLLIVTVLFVAALVIDRWALRARDYQRFESRAVLSQRLIFAVLVVVVVKILVATPFPFPLLALVAIAWMIWWLPESRRRFSVSAEAVFAIAPEAVASVMFDISQQPRWMESVIESVLETPGMLRRGSVVRQTVRVSGHDLTAKMLVTELVPYQRMVLTLQVRYAQPFDVFEVVPYERGSALVKYGGGHDLSRVNAILSGWQLGSLRKRFEKRRAANLERLRALVEPTPLSQRASG